MTDVRIPKWVDEHIRLLQAEFHPHVARKFVAGYREHGGDLFAADSSDVVKMALDEAVDLFVYLTILKNSQEGTPANFDRHVLMTARADTDETNCAFGISAEAGEIAAQYRKDAWKESSDEQLLSELGDLLWYVTRLAQLRGWSLSQVINFNMEKVKTRLKEGYYKGAAPAHPDGIVDGGTK